jgi:hypothetical protein
MGFITRHRIGGIHKEAKAQTKLMKAADARDRALAGQANDQAEGKDAAYWAEYVERVTAEKAQVEAEKAAAKAAKKHRS